MIKPSKPNNEQGRLKALTLLDILDTPAEERFDRLTRMAKRMFDVPIALVSLVDENRQWFKSCVGLEVSETPRDISFCGHAILGDEIFIIPDTHKDPRFADNPLVLAEPYIRFYAGCPLSYGSGHKLGTLCIIDKVPRELSPDDLLALKDLASTAERELAALQMATTDDLTSCLNRRGFLLLAQHTLNLCIRQKMPATLVFIDLNKFKSINDEFGHAEGDRALINFSHQISELCRETDVFARLGGDEFVALFPNTSTRDVELIVARLDKQVAKYNQHAKRGYDLTYSTGIVEFNVGIHTDIESLLGDADARMFDSKKR